MFRKKTDDVLYRGGKKCFTEKRVFSVKTTRAFAASNISPVFFFVSPQSNRIKTDRPAIFVQPNSSSSMCVFRSTAIEKGDSTLRDLARPRMRGEN